MKECAFRLSVQVKLGGHQGWRFGLAHPIGNKQGNPQIKQQWMD